MRRYNWQTNLVVLIISLGAALGIGELVLRLFFADYVAVHKEERSLLYRYNEELGWFPQPNSTSQFFGSRNITVLHNSRGFRDMEHEKNDKPGIAVIGDSFVWGYDVEQPERFTEHLRTKLPKWNIYNLGISGYGTDQEYLLLKQKFAEYNPQLVLLIFCTENDDFDNTTNSIGNGAYYKPYFTYRDGRLELAGVPVPKSLTYHARQHPILTKSSLVRLAIKSLSPKLVRNVISPTAAILQEMNDYVRSRGGQFVVGLVDPHPPLEYFLNSYKIPFINLIGAERYNEMGGHWTPRGHASIAATFDSYLRTSGLLDQPANR